MTKINQSIATKIGEKKIGQRELIITITVHLIERYFYIKK